jgi:quaternary ammonium compound-resistance protein SugE
LSKAWIFLIIAGFLEIGWAVAMKYSEGFSKLTPSIITILLMIASFYLLSVSVKTIPISIGYVIWTGIGAAGTAIVGMFLLGESKDIAKFICIFLILAGIVGLKLFSK